jgi:ribosome biogenesis GTPase
MDPATATAVVLGVAGGWVRLWRDGNESRATLPGRIRSPLAPGDEVTLAGPVGELRIAQVLPRRSILMRPDPHVAARGRILATNVDTVVIVIAGGPRAPRPGLVDRLLLAVERAEATPLVCVSKMDLAVRREVDTALAPFLDTAVRLVACSARTGAGLGELAHRLQDGRAVLVGQSGAGKTTLLNALVPGLALATNEVRRHDGKGRHTTSAATLVELPGGGQVLDTPGVRQFGLWAIERGDLERHFAELAAAAVDCRFGDCRHGAEPGCAVREAVAAGEIDGSRYASYRRLLAECEPGA